MNRVIVALVLLAALVSVLIIIIRPGAPQNSTSKIYYVNAATGNDTNNGKTSNNAFQTIQRAVDVAQAGETIQLAPGDYRQNVIFDKSNGRENKPITLTGPTDAIVRGTPGSSNNRVIQIRRDYIILSGFTVDGWRGPNDDRAGYSKQLIYIEGPDESSAHPKNIVGVRILQMTIKNALQECVRLRARAKTNEIAFSTISNCGICDFRLGCTRNKNGEGVYIGTEPDQLSKQGGRDDPSIKNHIHDNTITTYGSECIDVKEGTTGNIIEGNSCTGSQDPLGGGITIQGTNTIVRNNTIFGNAGTGIRLAGDRETDGRNNTITGNTINDNAKGGIEFEATPQDKVCGNKMKNNRRNAIGSKGHLFNPTAPC